jgi:preprotein translocase subunit SecG
VNTLITTIHIVICLILVVAVLLQSGKAADLAGAFGGVGSQTAFGARGTASILSKMTTISAILFMVTSLGLWILSGKETGSVLKGEKASEKQVPAVAETKKEAEAPKAQKSEEKQPPTQKQQKDSEKEKKGNK